MNSNSNIHISKLFSLEGRVALVTGGAGRFGRQISLALAEAGGTLLIASRDQERREGFAEELRKAGHKAEALSLDLSRADSIAELARLVGSKWPRLDVLFNNAVTITAKPLESYSVEEWARSMESNSTSLYDMCRTFGTMMARLGGGSIVNVGSIYGVVSPDFRIYKNHEEMTNPPSYGFFKAGMIQLTRYLAVYFSQQNVRVNCISPGGLYSNTMPDEFVKNYSARTPMGRMAGPNDLKGAALFFASDASAYVTGQNLLVDGGFTAF
jgi:NAD(P)-dependent dehydrogenase (short-subunit alcohol dehydrogenase family)